MKPFGKTRTTEQPLSDEAQQKLNASVELANLFAGYIRANSLEEALEEMRALAEETEPVQNPAENSIPETSETVSGAGERLAQAYRALEGSMDEEKLDLLMENEAFAALIQSGAAPLMAARCVLMDELLAAAEARGEKRGRAQAKNKLGRMNEVGTGMTNAFRTGIDPDKLSLKEIRDLKKRAGRGETITI